MLIIVAADDILNLILLFFRENKTLVYDILGHILVYLTLKKQIKVMADYVVILQRK